jgi:site-specific recombinase XerD
MMYRHGLRSVKPLGYGAQTWSFNKRASLDSTAEKWAVRGHPIAGDELRAIKRYLHTRDDALPRLFLSERGQPLTRQSVHYLIRTAAQRAELGAVHPHMLRHACGFYLAN